MKSVIFAFSLFCVSMISYAQSATITSDYKLLVPSDANTTYSVSKATLSTIKFLVSKQGEIQSYQIGFTFGGDYFTKKIEKNVFDADVTTKLVGCPAGTKFYLDDITIKAYTNPAVITSKAQFVLTD